MPATQTPLLPRDRILDATVKLVLNQGADAATTRAVALAAGVQAPAIYRLFGDKEGLLDAAAEHALANYVQEKSAAEAPSDPVEALRRGWDTHLEFALKHREIYRIILAKEATGGTAASRRGLDVLKAKIEAVAASGRLRLPVEQALDLFHAMAFGTILRLLGQEHGQEPDQENPLWDNAREAAIAAIIAGSCVPPEKAHRIAAISLKARLPALGQLSPGERLLMEELLVRIADSP